MVAPLKSIVKILGLVALGILWWQPTWRQKWGRKASSPPSDAPGPSDPPPTLEAYVEDQFEAAIRPIATHLDSALTNLETLGRVARQRRGPTSRAIWIHHHAYLRERLEDVRIIVGRIVEAKRSYVFIHASGRASRDERGGVPDLRLQILTTQMKLDFESLYIFGNLALDQWVMLVSALLGEPAGERPDFQRLMMTLQATGYAGVLQPVWQRHRNDLVWLYYHVRSVRNLFVEHLDAPLQRSQVLLLHGPDFELFMPTVAQDGVARSIGAAEEEAIRRLGRRYVTHVPSEGWNDYGFPYALRLVFMSIDVLDTQSERERVWEAWKRLGGQVPSYHIVARRLTRFLDQSLDTIAQLIDPPPGSPAST